MAGQAKVPVKGSDDTDYLIPTVPEVGQRDKASSLPVVMATDYREARSLEKRMWVFELPAFAAGGTLTVTGPTGAVTTSTVPANTAVKLLDQHPDRRNFRIMNASTGVAHYSYAPTVQPGRGWPVAAAPSVGGQGGSDEDTFPHPYEIYAVSAAGTILVVVEG